MNQESGDVPVQSNSDNPPQAIPSPENNLVNEKLPISEEGIHPILESQDHFDDIPPQEPSHIIDPILSSKLFVGRPTPIFKVSESFTEKSELETKESQSTYDNTTSSDKLNNSLFSSLPDADTYRPLPGGRSYRPSAKKSTISLSPKIEEYQQSGTESITSKFIMEFDREHPISKSSMKYSSSGSVGHLLSVESDVQRISKNSIKYHPSNEPVGHVPSSSSGEPAPSVIRKSMESSKSETNLSISDLVEGSELYKPEQPTSFRAVVKRLLFGPDQYFKTPDGERWIIPLEPQPPPKTWCGLVKAPNEVITSHYTILTFLPVQLFEQFFYNPVNLYFLGLMVLQQFRAISITQGLPTMSLPITAVLAVSAIKDFYEDWRRHRSDHKENTRKVIRVKSDGSQETITWRQIQMGDTLIIKNQEFIPTDLILCASRDPTGIAFVETSNLDGETNHKTKQSNLKGNRFYSSNLDECAKNWAQLKGEIVEEKPNANLFTYNASLSCEIKPDLYIGIPLDMKNLLLRGCRLVNSEWVIGKVCYAGHDTKIQKSTATRMKKKVSKAHRIMLMILVGIFLLDIIFCFIAGIFNASYQETDDALAAKYLNTHDLIKERFISTFLKRFCTYLLILGNFIPISLIVTTTMVRFIQAIFIMWDKSMEFDGIPAAARVSDINEELGQVDHVFCDKTGTITMNSMQFRKFCLRGTSYGATDPADAPVFTFTDEPQFGNATTMKTVQSNVAQAVFVPQATNETKFDLVDFYDHSLSPDCIESHPEKQHLIDMFLHWCINHTAFVREVNGVPNFSAGPEESALIEAAEYFGFQLIQRDSQNIQIKMISRDEILYVRVRANIEFTTSRRRSTVLAQYNCPFRKKDVFMVYCKGADSTIRGRLSPEERRSETMEETIAWNTIYAQDGLRTLMFAYRELTYEETALWLQEYEYSLNDVVAREQRIKILCNLLESNLLIQGVVGINDKLQPDVKQTIDLMKRGGMKVWMLTGDKTETAVNTATATGIIGPEVNNSIVAKLDWSAVGGYTSDSLRSGREDASSYMSIESVSTRGGDTREYLRHRLSNIGMRDDDTQSIDPVRKDADGKEIINSALLLNDLTNMSRRSIKTGDSYQSQTGTVIDYRIKEDPEDKTNAIVKQIDKYISLIDNGEIIDSFICDGPSLKIFFEHRPMDFLTLAEAAHGIVLCRMSPEQKGSVVEMVKLTGRITMAVGDGANDCKMILLANVGIGIRGEEGAQAFNSCDYGIKQFRALSPLLFVHGRYAYRRISIVILYMFYKNIIVVTSPFLLGAYSNFSGTTLYADIMYQAYNVLFTGLPIVFWGALDRDISRKQCFENPDLYRLGRENFYLNKKRFFECVGISLYHAFVIFFIPYFGLDPCLIPNPTGRRADIMTLGTVIMTLEVIVVNFKLMLEAYSHDSIIFITYFLSFGSYGAMIFVLCTFPFYSDQYGGFEKIGQSLFYMFAICMATLTACFGVSVNNKVFHWNFAPDPVQRVLQGLPLLPSENIPVTFKNMVHATKNQKRPFESDG